MNCIDTGKICPLNNLKCKNCKLFDCKHTLALIEEVEKMERKKNETKLDMELKLFYPECADCKLLTILDENKRKVYCSYRVKNKCIIK